MENEKPKGGGMEKLASFIVDKRNLFFLLYIFALIFSAIATGWVKVENDITTYLPDTTETRQGLSVMNDNFVTYGTANVMVSNITYDTALDIQSRLEDIEGVTTVEFDDTDEHYTNASALFSVSFDAEVGDERAENALQEIRDELEGSYDTSIYSEVGYDSSADLQSEMVVIVIIAAIIIVVVLTLTSRSYAEVPVLLMTFGAAALLNMGTNFLCGTISFISNSVTVILQLALAIDYAIILCHRFSDEHETLPTREACIAALSKAILEISSSSLTTISGLAALAFMHFGIGRDLATVLIKAILFSMLCVFTLMPGLLVLFSDIDGLYDADPRTHPDARLIHQVEAITPELRAMAGGLKLFNVSVQLPPRSTVCSTLRTLLGPSNWSSSSNQQMPTAPNGSFKLLSLPGSSVPKNKIFCPVGR